MNIRLSTSGHRGRLLIALVAIALGVAAPPASAGVERSCSEAAEAAALACSFDVKDDYWEAVAICLNEGDDIAGQECHAEAKAERTEAREECDDIEEARLDLCDLLGEEPYDPDFDPVDFISDFDLAVPNPYFPLVPGNRWVLAEDGATVTVEVLTKTKLIEGVTCIVVNDTEAEDGQVTETTDDWYAQSLAGDVWYCGEISQVFEYFEGDDPEEAELVEIEGSWKTGRDDAKPGVLMYGTAQEGAAYRQEWAQGEAEDAAEILAVDYAYGDDPELDEFVPQELAELLCASDCIVTLDFTPLEPDAEERKYYSPLVGLFLEIDLETGDAVQLVECNVDPACDLLPAP